MCEGNEWPVLVYAFLICCIQKSLFKTLPLDTVFRKDMHFIAIRDQSVSNEASCPMSLPVGGSESRGRVHCSDFILLSIYLGVTQS